MILAYRYRLLPSKRQHRAIEVILESQRALPERRQLREDTASPKETVYETVRRLGPATPAQITEEAGLHPRAVAGVLGTLKKQGRVIRTEEGLWGPAHQ